MSISPTAHSDVAGLIVAAGRGERAGGPVPKQYAMLGTITVLARSILAMAADCGPILVVIAAGDHVAYEACIAALPAHVREQLLPPVTGGATRQQSVLAGLEGLSASAPRLVLVHDAARPFVSRDLIQRVVVAARDNGAAIPAIPLADTVKAVSAYGLVTGTPDRAGLRAVQTPQGFRFDTLIEAHRRAAASAVGGLTDDASVLEWAGHPVHIVPGEAENMKLTTADDMAMAALRLSHAVETRVGSGYDVHAFTDGEFVTLGGIAIPHDRSLLGHSDADVVLHAITDAVLGALADGDIGQHFPPSDPQWRGAASDQFLIFAIQRLRAAGGRLVLLDVTIVCEAPKIGPHRDAMRARIAAISGVDIGRVAVKATTSEQLGFTGRREGIVAQALATVELPRQS